MEKILSGYCRTCDASRMVLVDAEEMEADCEYPDCPMRRPARSPCRSARFWRKVHLSARIRPKTGKTRKNRKFFRQKWEKSLTLFVNSAIIHLCVSA